MAAEKVWVVVEFKKLDTDVNAVRVFGSIKRMADEGIFITRSDGQEKKISQWGLGDRISKSRYWRDERYLIIEREVKKSKREIVNLDVKKGI